jgi:RNA polymerase sigma-70 factor, ECF subfamily
LLDSFFLRRLISVQHSSEELLLSFGRTLRTQESGADRVFEDLFADHYPRLVKTMLRLTGNAGTAEELAADAFCRLYQRRHGGSENAAGWLYRTAMNLGLDWLRANSRRARREDVASREAVRNAPERDPLDDLLAEEQRVRVRAVIAQLKPVQGQVLLMGSSGFSCKEMADVLGLKADSLYTLIARAKTEFEKKYVRLYGGEL